MGGILAASSPITSAAGAPCSPRSCSNAAFHRPQRFLLVLDVLPGAALCHGDRARSEWAPVRPWSPRSAEQRQGQAAGLMQCGLGSASSSLGLLVLHRAARRRLVGGLDVLLGVLPRLVALWLRRWCRVRSMGRRPRRRAQLRERATRLRSAVRRGDPTPAHPAAVFVDPKLRRLTMSSGRWMVLVTTLGWWGISTGCRCILSTSRPVRTGASGWPAAPE